MGSLLFLPDYASSGWCDLLFKGRSTAPGNYDLSQLRRLTGIRLQHHLKVVTLVAEAILNRGQWSWLLDQHHIFIVLSGLGGPSVRPCILSVGCSSSWNIVRVLAIDRSIMTFLMLFKGNKRPWVPGSHRVSTSHTIVQAVEIIFLPGFELQFELLVFCFLILVREVDRVN